MPILPWCNILLESTNHTTTESDKHPLCVVVREKLKSFFPSSAAVCVPEDNRLLSAGARVVSWRHLPGRRLHGAVRLPAATTRRQRPGALVHKHGPGAAAGTPLDDAGAVGGAAADDVGLQRVQIPGPHAFHSEIGVGECGSDRLLKKSELDPSAMGFRRTRDWIVCVELFLSCFAWF